MELFRKLLLLVLSAAFVENIVLVRGFCFGDTNVRATTYRSAAIDSLWALPLCLAAALAGWLGGWLVLNWFPIQLYLRPPIYLGVYLVLFFLIQLPFRYIYQLKRCGMKFLDTHSAAAFGLMPLGVLLIIGQGAYTLPEALCFALGTAVGYFLAAELCLSLYSWMSLTRLPKAMRGAPALLLCMGLLSLAFFVLLGHELAL